MRTLALGMLASCVASLAGAQPAYTFAGLTWGSPSSAIKAQLENRGYTFDKIDNDGDLDFHGTVGAYPTDMYAMLDTAGRLVKVIVNIQTPDEDAERMYHDMVDQLTSKYGKPDFHSERFDDPYYAGDGYEQTAIRSGKGHFLTCWNHGRPAAENQEALCNEISTRLTVQVTYESEGWTADMKRRQRRRAKDF